LDNISVELETSIGVNVVVLRVASLRVFEFSPLFHCAQFENIFYVLETPAFEVGNEAYPATVETGRESAFPDEIHVQLLAFFSRDDEIHETV
jgi:hypothetical protein